MLEERDVVVGARGGDPSQTRCSASSCESASSVTSKTPTSSGSEISAPGSAAASCRRASFGGDAAVEDEHADGAASGHQRGVVGSWAMVRATLPGLVPVETRPVPDALARNRQTGVSAVERTGTPLE